MFRNMPSELSDLPPSYLASRLLTDEVWLTVCKSLPPTATADAVLQQAVQQKLLTPWQADRLRVGQSAFHIGRYVLEEAIGKGAFGTVYRARHTLMNRVVALKVLPRELTREPYLIARFQQEIRTAAALDHPNIVSVYDADSSGKTHFLAMQFVAGQDLAAVLRQNGPLPISAACSYAYQTLLGLQHAFVRGTVHRDIKPSNLMLMHASRTTAAVVQILDFGLARFVSETSGGGSLTVAGQVLGTPDYMSPEQADDVRRADIRSDIYSLGCTLFRLLCDRVPFPGDSVVERLVARTRERAPRITDFRPEVPTELADVLQKMLEPDPTDRYQTPAAAAAALSPWISDRVDQPDGSTATRTPAADDHSAADLRRGTHVVDQSQRVIAAGSMGDGLSPVGDSSLSDECSTITELPATARDATVSARDSTVSARDSTVSVPHRTKGGDGLASSQAIPVFAETSSRKRNANAESKPGAATWIVLAAAVLAALCGWFFFFPSETVKLEIVWPLEERRGGELRVNGKLVSLPATAGLVRKQIPMTSPSVLLEASRPGFADVSEQLEVVAGRAIVWEPKWLPNDVQNTTNAGNPSQDLAILLNTARGDDPAAAAKARAELVLRLRREGDPVTAEKLAAVIADIRWPVDSFPTIDPGALDATAVAANGNDADLSQLRRRPEGLDLGTQRPRELVAAWGDDRLKHWETIQHLCCSDDGKWLASTGDDRLTGIWETQTGENRRWFRSAPRLMRPLFLPGTSHLVFADDAAQLQIADVASGRLLARLPGSKPPVAVICDGKSLITSRITTGLVRWDLVAASSDETPSSSGANLKSRSIDVPGVTPESNWSVSNDGRWLAVEDATGVSVYDLNAGPAPPPVNATAPNPPPDATAPNPLEPSPSPVDAVASAPLKVHFFEGAKQPLFSPVDAQIAVSESRDAVVVYNVAETKASVIQRLDESGSPLRWSSDGEMLATRLVGRVLVWNVATAAEKSTWTDAEQPPDLFSGDLSLAAAGETAFGQLRVWTRGRLLPRVTLAHPGGMTAAALSADDGTLFTAGADHTIKLWYPEHVTERLLDGAGVGPADVSLDGRRILIATEDGSLRIRDLVTGAAIKLADVSTGALTAGVSASETSTTSAPANAAMAAAIGQDDVIQQRTYGARQLEFSGDGRVIAAVGTWGEFKTSLAVWTAAGSRLDLPAALTESAVSGFVFLPGASRMLILAKDRPVLFDPAVLLQTAGAGRLLSGETDPLKSTQPGMFADGPLEADGEPIENGGVAQAATIQPLDDYAGMRMAAAGPTVKGSLLCGVIGERELVCLQLTAATSDAAIAGVTQRWKPLRLDFSPTAIDVSSCTEKLAVAAPGGVLYLFSTVNGEFLDRLTGANADVRSLDFAPTGDRLLAATAAGRLHVWNLPEVEGDRNRGQRASGADGGLLAGELAAAHSLRLCSGDGVVFRVRFLSEGRHVLSCNGNGTVWLLRWPGVEQ